MGSHPSETYGGYPGDLSDDTPSSLASAYGIPDADPVFALAAKMAGGAEHVHQGYIDSAKARLDQEEFYRKLHADREHAGSPDDDVADSSESYSPFPHDGYEQHGDGYVQYRDGLMYEYDAWGNEVSRRPSPPSPPVSAPEPIDKYTGLTREQTEKARRDQEEFYRNLAAENGQAMRPREEVAVWAAFYDELLHSPELATALDKLRGTTRWQDLLPNLYAVFPPLHKLEPQTLFDMLLKVLTLEPSAWSDVLHSRVPRDPAVFKFLNMLLDVPSNVDHHTAGTPPGELQYLTNVRHALDEFVYKANVLGLIELDDDSDAEEEGVAGAGSAGHRPAVRSVRLLRSAREIASAMQHQYLVGDTLHKVDMAGLHHLGREAMRGSSVHEDVYVSNKGTKEEIKRLVQEMGLQKLEPALLLQMANTVQHMSVAQAEAAVFGEHPDPAVVGFLKAVWDLQWVRMSRRSVAAFLDKLRRLLQLAATLDLARMDSYRQKEILGSAMNPTLRTVTDLQAAGEDALQQIAELDKEHVSKKLPKMYRAYMEGEDAKSRHFRFRVL
jgi:hypothetical protein